MRLKRLACFTILLGTAIATATAQEPHIDNSTTVFRQFGGEPVVRLNRHVLPAIRDANLLPGTQGAAAEPLTLTLTLNWSDPVGLEAFGKEFEDPTSANYHHLIAADELTARFGPTQKAYGRVLAYLQQQGFSIVRGSANRLTITARGTRSQAERMFNLSIGDYQLGDRKFHANSVDPAIPQSLAPIIRSISGLSNLSVPYAHAVPSPGTPASVATAYNIAGLPPGINGAGETIGLIEFDNFAIGDVSNWLFKAGLPGNLVNQVNTSLVNGGTGPSGCNPSAAGCGESEVLADVAAVLGIAPGANIIVFVAPQGTNTIDAINAAINGVRASNGGFGGIVSTSWAQCEREITDSDADSMESLLQAASYSGLTLFASSGDNGSTCVNGSTIYPNRVSYPSDTPHAVSVGGTTIQVGPGNAYQSESWWDSSFDNGSFGTAGYGFSWHFGEPSYQSPFVSAAGRSVPDVAAEAGDGIFLCQAFGGVSPNCLNFVGTSIASPLWAGIWALVSQEQNLAYGSPGIPAGGGYLYTIPQAFQSATGMTGPGNDFGHLGLGSPNITKLVAAVTGPAQVTGINPNSGPVRGGTTATITGHGFIGVSQVYVSTPLGNWPVTSFKILSESQIQIVTPPCSSPNYCAAVDIDILTLVGSSQPSKAKFAYVAGITSVTPTSGTMDGGTVVTIVGSGFDYTGGQKFYFGRVPAVNVTCSSSTVCTMLSPREAPGTVDVLAAGADLRSLSAQFTFTGPTITRIDPVIGAQIGGTYVNIYGTSLSNSMTVKFGNTQVSAPLCLGDTWCTVYSPAGAGSVPVTATVGNLTTVATPADVFTYEPLPYGTLSPGSGPDTGGTVVTVIGGNFDPAPGATRFTFSSAYTPDQPATKVSCSSTSICTFTTPPCNSTCMINAYAGVTATVDGVSRAIYGFSYYFSSPPPPAPVPKPPPGSCGPRSTDCQ